MMRRSYGDGYNQEISQAEQYVREIQRLEVSVAEALIENAALLHHREELLSSRSWRVTSPLRWLSGRMSALTPRRKKGGRNCPRPDRLPAELVLSLPATLDGTNSICQLLNLGPKLAGLLPPSILPLINSRLAARSAPELQKLAPLNSPSLGFIGSAEFRNELAFDCKVYELPADGYQSVLAQADLRFVVVEAIWVEHGQDWIERLWDEGNAATPFANLAAHCRTLGVPIVLWFREPIGSWERFAWLAEFADIVCILDPEVSEALRERYPNISVMDIDEVFQPAISNPVTSCDLMRIGGALKQRVVYDGWWEALSNTDISGFLELLKPAGLLITESHWDYSYERLRDAGVLAEASAGCLSIEEQITLARLQGTQIFFARSMVGHSRQRRSELRAIASGSLVVHVPSSDKDGLISESSSTSASALVGAMSDPVSHDCRSHLAWREAMDKHTLARRLALVISKLEVKASFAQSQPSIACLLVSMRPHLLCEFVRRFNRDIYSNRELIIVLNTDYDSREEVLPLLNLTDKIQIHWFGKNRSLGACLNFAITQTSADYWTKMDDDDLYGPNYLSDIVRYLHTGSHQVFGKPPVFNYFESDNCLLWDPEWARYANVLHQSHEARAALIAGGTIGGKREILDLVPFSETRRGGSDSDFIRRCYAAGLDVLSMDGFNFVRFRSASAKFHTWNMPEEELRSRGIVVGGRESIEQIAFI